MKTLRVLAGLCVVTVSIGAASPALALTPDLVFVSAASGSDANACDVVTKPCQTLAVAVARVGPGGEVLVLDSGDYGPVTITQGVTIVAPTGVTAIIQAWGTGTNAITVNASASDTVTLRGLTIQLLALQIKGGIVVNSVGTINVANCSIQGFQSGIQMLSAGRLTVNGTDIRNCEVGVELVSGMASPVLAGHIQASIDHCHLDTNSTGFRAGSSMWSSSTTTTATYTTANGNMGDGWVCGWLEGYPVGHPALGVDVLSLEFCSGSENSSGLGQKGWSTLSAARYSNSVFANNYYSGVAVSLPAAGTVETRGNNTITGNGGGPTSGTINSFSPM